MGSTALSTLLTSFVNRKDAKQQRQFNYTDKLEQRLEKLERRVDRFEFRDNIYTSATACAYSCKLTEDGNCPVLSFLESHPVPDKE